MAREPLISISEASRILGVSEVSLRQWTDEGKIKAFVTPGGHRRYSREELTLFMGSQHRMLGMQDLVQKLQDTPKTLRGVLHTSIETTSRYSKLDTQSREQLAELGRRLLSLTEQYITEPSKRDENIKVARDIGKAFGVTLIECRLSVTDSVEAFILHRETILQAATHLVSKKEAYGGRIVEAIPLIGRVLDEALVALVSAYQQHPGTFPKI